MEFKGTKNKWQIAGVDKTFVYALNDKGTNAFSLSINNDGRTAIEEQQANSLLISKAPEMLQFLKEIKQDYDEGLIEDVEDIVNRAERLFNEATDLSQLEK